MEPHKKRKDLLKFVGSPLACNNQSLHMQRKCHKSEKGTPIIFNGVMPSGVTSLYRNFFLLCLFLCFYLTSRPCLVYLIYSLLCTYAERMSCVVQSIRQYCLLVPAARDTTVLLGRQDYKDSQQQLILYMCYGSLTIHFFLYLYTSVLLCFIKLAAALANIKVQTLFRKVPEDP